MTVPAVVARGADPLSPLRATLRAVANRPGTPVFPGISPELDPPYGPDWMRASELVSGVRLDDFLDTAKQRWRATPHAAAALAWKCYSYWLALPAVLGYAAARRVPMVRPHAVAWQCSPDQPFLFMSLVEPEVAVLASDPLALDGPRPGIKVVADDAALLRELRFALLDLHLEPLMHQIRTDVKVSRHTFLGSLASGIAHGLSRAADVLPGSTLQTADEVLTALEIRHLVDLAPRSGGRAGIEVQRRTCCLAFTLPEPKICSGCCIR